MIEQGTQCDKENVPTNNASMPGHCSDQDEVNTAIPDIFTKTYNFDGHQYHKKDKPTLHKGDLSWSAIYRCKFYRTKYNDVNGCPGIFNFKFIKSVEINDYCYLQARLN